MIGFLNQNFLSFFLQSAFAFLSFFYLSFLPSFLSFPENGGQQHANTDKTDFLTPTLPTHRRTHMNTIF